MRGSSSSSTAVSYTHLDVYKRQVRHREELLRQAMRYAAERAAGQAARSIASGGRRVRENRGGSSCVSRPDPRKLSSEELADIRRRVQSGEKIRF